MPGPQGPKGDTGPQGEQGVQGPEGPAGSGVTLAEVIDALYPVGHTWISKLATNPGTLLGRGTWTQTSQGLYLVGQTGAQSGGDQVGSATHSHGFTQPAAHTIGAVAATATGAVKIGTSGTTAAAQTHTHAAPSIDAHAGGAVTDGTVAPAGFVVYVFERTA